MITPRKILLGIFSFFVFLFLFYSSYIYQKNTSNFITPKVENIIPGTYFLNNGEIKTEGTTDDIQAYFLNHTDQVLSYKSKLDIQNNKIYTEKGNFLVNIQEINSNYTIHGEGFLIKSKGPTSLYIDNSGTRTYIYSLNSIIEVELQDPKTSKKVNVIYLYPNEYIAFSPSINKIIKGADVLRVSQIFSLNSINESITKTGAINPDWKTKFPFGDNSDTDKLEEMFLFIMNNKGNNTDIVKKFINNTKVKISGESFIEKYFSIFLNPEKKKIYFKNIIIREAADILSQPKIKLKDAEYMKESLGNLQKLDKGMYTEMKDIVLYYLHLAESIEEDVEKKVILAKIIAKTQNSDFSFIDDGRIKLEQTFNNYNFGDNKDLYEGIKTFAKTHIKPDTSFEQKGYFIFFLNKSILGGFENINEGKNINFGELLSVIHYFTDTSIDFYEAKSIKNDTKRNKIIETGIKTYNTILKKLTRRIRDNYFEKELTPNNLLIKKKNIEIGSSEVTLLENNIKSIYFFFKRNKSVLAKSSINILTQNEFGRSKKYLDSYFEALTDYSKYELNNNNIYEDLRSDEKGEKIEELKVIDAKRYLSKFNYIDINNAQITIKNSDYCLNPQKKSKDNTSEEKEENDNPFCFEITNLKVGDNKIIDFLLFPSLQNRIDTKTTVGKEEKYISYTLDNLESQYKNNVGGGKDKKDTEKYKFENFFLYTFNPPKTYKKQDIYKGKDYTGEKESDIIIALKRGIFLGNNGTFSVVQDYIKVKYNNIVVKEIQNTLDIQVQNADFHYKIGEQDYFGILNSKYIYKKGRTSAFKNPEIILTDSSRNSSLGGNKIHINGIFPLKNFKNELKDIFTYIKNVSEIVDIIYQATYETEVHIRYSSVSNKFFLSTKQIQIILKGNFLEKVVKNGKNLLTKPDKIDNLGTYFNIKK